MPYQLHSDPSSPARAALAQAARAGQGIPETLPSRPGVPNGKMAQSGSPEILSMLRNGQMSAEALMQLVAMLMGMGGTPGAQAPAEGGSPIESAMLMGGEGAGGY